MNNKYLPIGTICTLKGKVKKMMITGYYSVKFNGNIKINDYVGCVYPEGLLLPEQTMTFNHSDIEKVDFLGYKDNEFDVFIRQLNRITGNVSDVEDAKSFHEAHDMYLTSNSTYSKLLFDENGVVMIADLVEPKKEEKPKASNIDNEDVKNPFYREYDEKENSFDEKPSDWKIFNKIEFDEDGTVVSANLNTSSLNQIEFDENGTVISVGGEALKENDASGSRGGYTFDKDGTVVSLDDSSVPAVGPGLKGYKGPVSKGGYTFDKDGNVIDLDDSSVPAVGPGLKGYKGPSIESKKSKENASKDEK